jgi:hypothetical protein
MSSWVITSWVFVLILTGVNIFIFLKLKGASEQMLKMAFPNAKNMNDALGQMQKMMGGRMPGGKGGAKNANTDAQLKQAMAMLKNMKK